ncbi:hypothetical protein BGX24_010136 [Mortierella sp. AD032]|nr:hypothetical protein BGX24_010136 [Mortierella sp. AD032]
MSHTQRTHQTTGGPAAASHASHPTRTTTASAIPTAATNHNAITPVLDATSTTTSSDSSASDNAAVVPVKRGRGRPRKIPLETSNNDSNNATSPSDNTTPEAGPRKRGRPRLNKPVVEKLESVPKRGRGRPRKIPANEGSDSKKASTSSPTSAQRPSSAAHSISTSMGHHASASEPPRKRGRPRKV